jgi:hypothetical protein
VSDVVPDTTDLDTTDLDTTDDDATPAGAGASDAAGSTRQCGRCRGHFPIEGDVHPMELRDWWACASCAESLLPGRRSPAPPLERHRGRT